MKNVIPVILFLFVTSQVAAQDVKFHNNIFIEAAGNGGAYSINYDRLIYDNFSVRIGASLINSDEDQVKSFPILANYRLYTNRNNYMEFGLGTTLFTMPLELGSFFDEDIDDNLITGVISYCFQSNNGFNARVAFTPFYYNEDLLLFGGFSFGYSF